MINKIVWLILKANVVPRSAKAAMCILQIYVYFANLSKHSKEQRKTLYKMASIMFNKDFGGKEQ